MTPSQSQFLVAYRLTGNISEAARAANIHRSNHHRWLGESDRYAEAFKNANDQACDLLELEARRRAVDGVIRYKFDKLGNPILNPNYNPETDPPQAMYYFELVYSDQLLIALLKANRPGKFKDRIATEVSGPDGQPLEVTQAMRQMAIANPEMAEKLCQALENATNPAANAPEPIVPSDALPEHASLTDSAIEAR